MSTYIEKLKSPEWQKKRLEVLQRDNFECKNCFDKESELHIHHLEYDFNKNPYEYENESLLTLCCNCHEQYTEHYKNIKSKVLKLKHIEQLDMINDILDVICYISIGNLFDVRNEILNKF